MARACRVFLNEQILLLCTSVSWSNVFREESNKLDLSRLSRFSEFKSRHILAGIIGCRVNTRIG